MPVTDDAAAARRLAERLEELGVETSQDEAEELASAYPALEAWIRIAAELAKDDKLEVPDSGSR
jgi:hypothetical protein